MSRNFYQPRNPAEGVGFRTANPILMTTGAHSVCMRLFSAFIYGIREAIHPFPSSNFLDF